MLLKKVENYVCDKDELKESVQLKAKLLLFLRELGQKYSEIGVNKWGGETQQDEHYLPNLVGHVGGGYYKEVADAWHLLLLFKLAFYLG